MRALLACSLGLLLGAIATPSHAVTPTHIWSERFGDVDQDQGNSVCVDPSGNIIVAGFFVGTTDFGGGPVISNGSADVFLAKYDANGNHIWDRRFGGTSRDEAWSVATDAAGNIIMTGFFRFTANFGGAPLVSAGNDDIFLAKYTPGGVHLWSKRFGDISRDDGVDVAVDANGNIGLVGYFRNTLFLGGPPLPSAGNDEIFAAKFDPAGNHLWSQRWGGSANDQGDSIEFDSAGNVIVLSHFEGNVSFGGAPLINAGSADIALAKYDPNGVHLWSERFGDTSNDLGRSVAVDGVDNIYMGAVFQGSPDFGGGPLTSAGDYDIVLAKYDPNGAHQWSQRFGDTDPDFVMGVAADNAGNVAMTGTYRGTVNFGGGPFTTAGVEDIYLATYDTNGAPEWTKSAGDTLTDAGNSIAWVGSGCAVATGFFEKTVDFGGGPLTSAGFSDMFLAKYCAESPVPVLISQFRATPGARGVDLAWDFSSDETVEGFTLYRGRETGTMAEIATGDARTTRSYTDASVDPGVTYRYQLVIHTAAAGDFQSPLVAATMPRAVASLGQNFPNPFNPRTAIEYTVSGETRVSIEIFDVSGKLVRALDQGIRRAGTYHAQWDGRDNAGRAVGSGVYLYRLAGVRDADPRKMVLLK